MLTKLLKHEFRATARIMGPLYLVLLAVALGFNFSARLMDSGNFVLNMLAALVVMAYVVAITAVFIVAFILMLQRFYKNLLGDEGYIMFTLPASVHQHVWSKLIVSAVWFIATGVVVFLSVFVAAFNVSFLTDLASVFPKLFQQMTAYYAVNGTVFALELLALMLAACMISPCSSMPLWRRATALPTIRWPCPWRSSLRSSLWCRWRGPLFWSCWTRGRCTSSC